MNTRRGLRRFLNQTMKGKLGEVMKKPQTDRTAEFAAVRVNIRGELIKKVIDDQEGYDGASPQDTALHLIGGALEDIGIWMKENTKQ